MNKHKKTIYIAITVFSSAFFWYFTQKDATVENINWKCDQHNCDISFEIKNRTNKYVDQNISIRAIQQIDKGEAGGTSSNILGEDVFQITLHSHDTQKIERNLNLSFPGRVRMVTVNNWSVENKTTP